MPRLLSMALAAASLSESVASRLHAVAGNCTGEAAQHGWVVDTTDDTIKFGSVGCLSEPLDWVTYSELEVVPCEKVHAHGCITAAHPLHRDCILLHTAIHSSQGSPKQNFTFDAATRLIKHGAYCLGINVKDQPNSAMRLEISGCGGRWNRNFADPKQLFAMPTACMPMRIDMRQGSATPRRKAVVETALKSVRQVYTHPVGDAGGMSQCRPDIVPCSEWIGVAHQGRRAVHLCDGRPPQELATAAVRPLARPSRGFFFPQKRREHAGGDR